VNDRNTSARPTIIAPGMQAGLISSLSICRNGAAMTRSHGRSIFCAASCARCGRTTRFIFTAGWRDRGDMMADMRRNALRLLRPTALIFEYYLTA